MKSKKWTNFLINAFKNANNYLEFGAGESTILASKYVKNKIISIESDQFWIKNVKKKQKGINITFFYIEMKTKPNRWGYPGSRATDDQKRQYSQIIQKIDMKCIDLILIDGRFRVACALHLLPYITENTVVLFDDFTDRPEYHILLKFYDIIDKVVTMVKLKKKKDVTMDEQLLKKYELVSK